MIGVWCTVSIDSDGVWEVLRYRELFFVDDRHLNVW